MRNKKGKPRVEPSAASVPHGQYFSFRIAEPADLSGYKVHWFCDGRRLPGAHKTELCFFQVRAKYEGTYKAVLVKGTEVLASNLVTLKALPQNAQAVIVAEKESAPAEEGFFFDPLAPEAPEASETLETPETLEALENPENPEAPKKPEAQAPQFQQAESETEEQAAQKKKAFLKKALSKTKKVA